MEAKERVQNIQKEQDARNYPPMASRLTNVSASGELPEKTLHCLDPKSSAKARGKRLRTARMMIGLTRKNLEERYGISASTVQAWEAAKAGGLTERGVARILPVLHQEGISCKAEWLLYEIGAGPQQCNSPLSTLEQELTEGSFLDNKLITQELLIFRSLHPGAIDLVVSDDGMGPNFHEGDYIAGIHRTGDWIKSVLGLDCIVQTISGSTLFRRVKQSARPGLYNLLCINPSTTVIETTLYNQSLISAAPVVWHRRGDAANPPPYFPITNTFVLVQHGRR